MKVTNAFMLLCLTTVLITGFQSCQKETPHFIEATHELDQIEPAHRIGLFEDIENDLEEKCDCCIRFVDFEVNLPEGHYALQLTGGYNGVANPCPSEIPQLPDCPFFNFQEGDCRDELPSSNCTELTDFDNGNLGCRPFNCAAEPGGALFFSATMFHVNPSDCSMIIEEQDPPIEASITFVMECIPNDARCYGEIADDGTGTDDPNPGIPSNPIPSSTVITIDLQNFGQGVYFGGVSLPLPEGKCCEVIY